MPTFCSAAHFVCLMGFYVTAAIFQLYRDDQFVVEEAGVPWENHQPWASNWQTLSHASRAHLFS